MEEQLNLKIAGHVVISSGTGEVLLDEHNAIGADSLEIVLNCLSQLGGAKHVDNIEVTGAFGIAIKPINAFTYDDSTNTVTFQTEFLEDDFNGTVTDMRLLSLSLLTKVMATKDSLNVLKDDQTRLRVSWSITINNC